MGIEQSVQCFRAAREFDEVSFQRFGECVEQTPSIPWCERFVSRFSPLVQHARDEFVRAYPDIHGAHDQVVCGAVFDIGELIRRDAVVLVAPAVHEFADGALNEARQVAGDVRGVFARQLYLTGKAEVVADENTRPGGNACGECFVVTVSQAEHPAVVFRVLFAQDFHQSEIALTVVAQAVGLGSDDEAVRSECALDLGDKFEVWDGRPCGRCARRRHELDFGAFYFLSSAVEAEVWMGAFCGCGLVVNKCDHGVLLSVGAPTSAGAGLFHD